jgi:hypothetical protein
MRGRSETWWWRSGIFFPKSLNRQDASDDKTEKLKQLSQQAFKSRLVARNFDLKEFAGNATLFSASMISLGLYLGVLHLC